MDTQSIPLVSGFARAALLAVALLPISVWALSPQEAQSMIERAQVGAEADSHGALTLPELMKALGVPGVSVAIVQDYEIHWANAYGVADIETGEPVDTQTLFQAASISKPVAAMASLLAVQQG
ncbi:MAG: serine hydrolase domain-containing protein, partial [Pseudomonadota bacterium]